jgi:putative glutamine transport system permease protein
MEAALSQGFTHLQAMRYIILPQSVKIALPPLANQMVALIKNTSVLAMIAGGDLMYRSNAWASNGTLSYGPAYLVCGILFFCLCFPLTYFAKRYERKLKNQTNTSGKEASAE